MRGYRPATPIRIAKPCGESWEALPGDSRIRHCGVCDRDVHNVAAMVPAQLEAVLAQPGPLPCMRLVQYEDGSLLTARTDQKPNLLRRASMALSTVMLMAGGAAAQTSTLPKQGQMAVLQGRVVDATGASISHAKIELLADGKQVISAETDSQGAFVLTALPGAYTFDVTSSGFKRSDATPVQLHAGTQQASNPILLQLAVSEVMGVCVGTQEQMLFASPPDSALLSPVPTPQWAGNQRRRKAASKSLSAATSTTTPKP
jgi:Carboxypeptidase regulatory-like domain